MRFIKWSINPLYAPQPTSIFCAIVNYYLMDKEKLKSLKSLYSYFMRKDNPWGALAIQIVLGQFGHLKKVYIT